jgi:hypothetical protein
LAFLAVTLVGCAPGFSDSGNASLTLTVEGQDPITVIHDPLRSRVSLTPPAGGEVRLSSINNDPFVEVTIGIDANLVSEGDDVGLPVEPPLTDNDLFVLVEMSDDAYSSEDSQARGMLSFPTLFVSEDSADVQVELDATLIGSEGSLSIDGFIEDSTGTTGSSI